MNDQVLEGHFLSFSDEAIEHDTHSQEDILHEVRIDWFFGGVGLGDGSEPWDVFSDQFTLQDPGYLCGSFDLCDVVLVNLSPDCLQEFFLLPTFVFDLLFDYFNKLLAVLWVA